MSRILAAAVVSTVMLVACGPKEDEGPRAKAPDPTAESAPGAAADGTKPDQPAAPLPALAGAQDGASELKHAWSIKVGGTAADAARAVTVDKDGNYLVTGYFGDKVDFGAGALESFGGQDVFIAKYDAAGKLLWAKQFGGPGEDIGQAVATDSQGNIVVTGTFTDEAEFGSGKTFESKGRTDVFVARYSSDGEHLWSRRAGGEVEDRGYAVAIDSKDSVIVTGYFGGAVAFGGDPMESAGQADIFVVKYAASSEHIWSWRIGGKVDDLGRAVAVDAQDNVVLAGDFHETISLGGAEQVSTGNADILLAKFTSNGKYLWAKTFGSYFHDFSVGVAVDGKGHIAITGAFEQTVDFGGDELVGAEKKEIFLAKYTGDGRHLWSKRFGGRDDDIGSSVAVDGYGNVYMAGWFWRTVDFGGGKLESAGDNDIVLAKYAPDGTFVSAKQFGDIGADFGRSVAIDHDGSAVMVGTFRGKVSFGGDELVYNGDKKRPHGDAFVVKFTQTGP
jgi:hypothetical protein